MLGFKRKLGHATVMNGPFEPRVWGGTCEEEVSLVTRLMFYTWLYRVKGKGFFSDCAVGSMPFKKVLD